MTAIVVAPAQGPADSASESSRVRSSRVSNCGILPAALHFARLWIPREVPA